MASSSGPLSGMTLKIARSPAGSMPIGVTVCTSSTVPIACAMPARSCGFIAAPPAPGSAVTSSGAL